MERYLVSYDYMDVYGDIKSGYTDADGDGYALDEAECVMEELLKRPDVVYATVEAIKK